MSNDPKLSKLDANQVLRNSYNDETNELRVAASVTASIGELDLAIDAQRLTIFVNKIETYLQIPLTTVI